MSLADRALKARAAFDAAAMAIDIPDPDIVFAEDMTAIVDAAQSILDWLDQVEPYLRKPTARKLRRLLERTVDETITLAELRELQPTQDQAAAEVTAAVEALELRADELEVELAEQDD